MENKKNSINIQNKEIKVKVNLHGAELVSLVDLTSDREYMWSGDSKYWGRVSPVLFPFVGKLNKQTYRYEGNEYTNIPQHGFARDCEFEVVEKSEDEVWLKLLSSELMMDKYPFDYALYIGYRLDGRKVHVMWKVENLGKKDLHFSIGAHPAFMCPGMDEGKKYYLDFHRQVENLESGIINSEGVLGERTKQVKFDRGVLELSQELFSEDALIFSGDGISEVSILNEDRQAFLSVKFNTPQLGIWSPVGKNAPFVCIEPWYGRCDREGFEGELKNREYGNTLEANHTFEKEYVIEV